MGELRAQTDSIRIEGEFAARARAQLATKEEALAACLEHDSLPRRNDLPATGIAGLEDLKAAGCPGGGLPIIVVSCPWTTPYHPDPKAYYMDLVAAAIKPFVAQGTKYGVFWDWVSMFQNEGRSNLSANEQEMYDEAVSFLPILMSHEYTTVLRVTSLPPGYPEGAGYETIAAGANTAKYPDRGWCFTESIWASWPNKKTLDVGRFAAARTRLGTGAETIRFPKDLRELLNICAHSEDRREPPILPKQFKEIIVTKSMANPKDDAQLLMDLYDDSFAKFFGAAYKLNYAGLGWGDEEAEKFAELLSSGVAKKLVLVHLSMNKIEERGMRALAAAITSGGVPLLSTIVLQGNPGDSSIVEKAIAQRSKERKARQIERRRRMSGEQRPNTAPSSASSEQPTTVIASSSLLTLQPRQPIRFPGSPWTAQRRQVTIAAAQAGDVLSL